MKGKNMEFKEPGLNDDSEKVEEGTKTDLEGALKEEKSELTPEEANLKTDQMFKELFPNGGVDRKKFESDIKKIFEAAAGKPFENSTQDEKDSFYKKIYQMLREFRNMQKNKEKEDNPHSICKCNLWINFFNIFIKRSFI